LPEPPWLITLLITGGIIKPRALDIPQRRTWQVQVHSASYTASCNCNQLSRQMSSKDIAQGRGMSAWWTPPKPQAGERRIESTQLEILSARELWRCLFCNNSFSWCLFVNQLSPDLNVHRMCSTQQTAGIIFASSLCSGVRKAESWWYYGWLWTYRRWMESGPYPSSLIDISDNMYRRIFEFRAPNLLPRTTVVGSNDR
jgi:hypothetical protein